MAKSGRVNAKIAMTRATESQYVILNRDSVMDLVTPKETQKYDYP